MCVKTYGSALHGIDAVTLTLEVRAGLKGSPFITGLPNQEGKACRQRIEAAITNNGFELPGPDVGVTIMPEEAIGRAGSACDLPIALGILAATEQIALPEGKKYVMAGALSPDGTVMPVKGALPMAISARKEKFSGLIVPEGNAREAATVNDLEVYGIRHLRDIIRLVNAPSSQEPVFVDTRHEFFQSQYNFELDFSEVKGQEKGKRALEIAAAGGHSLLLVGSPGPDKSRLAKRLPTILPPLTLRQALDITKIHSVAGKLPEKTGLISHRPFRAPHHTINDVALTGGARALPGELALAHCGVLFMEELPAFSQSVRDVLQRAMEERPVAVSGINGPRHFSAGFMLVASMSPCPCGYLNHPERACTCPPGAVLNYLKCVRRLLDGIDLQAEVESFSVPSVIPTIKSSASVRERVIGARERQATRFADQGAQNCNAHMSGALLEKACPVDKPSSNLLKVAMKRLQLPAPAYERVLKISRTIADLEGAEMIKAEHIAEAIQYRILDRRNWGG